MRRFVFVLTALILAASLHGCAADAPSPEPQPTEPVQTQPLPDPQPTEPVESQPLTTPVEEDVFYYSNELEYSRLYSQREDGTDLKLVLDEYCDHVQQSGDTVYFTDGLDLHSYHIPTGTNQTLIKGVLNYEVDGDDLVYSLGSDEPVYDDLPYNDLRYRNMKTGEDFLIRSASINWMTLGQGKVYYVEVDYDDSIETLKVFDISTRQTTIISDQYLVRYSLVSGSEGVYYRGYTSQWYFASADGATIKTLDYISTEDYELIHITDNGALCLNQDYTEGGISSVIYYDTDGTNRLLFESEPSAYIYQTALGNDRWLIRQQVSVGLGDLNEFGSYDDYARHISYFLLKADGTVTPLDTAGELGSMFAGGDFPLLDSSTARKPVTRALYDLFVRNFDYEGKEPLCSTTHGAWTNIADRKVDLALLAAPTEEEQAYLEQQGVEVELKLYGGDGLVFIGNAANPVTNLTHEQIIAIYRSEITNWSEVGGPDHPITVYYRDDQSGSQRLFESLVFKGEELPDFLSMDFVFMDDMSSIVDMALSDPYSIGYSIMTYLDEVYAEKELQVFSVNGINPSPDTIKDGTYPYNTKGYLVIRSDEPADSPARRLFDWFGCPVSNELLTFNGISPLSDGVG